MLAFTLVIMLLTPGMEHPTMKRYPMTSYESCLGEAVQLRDEIEKIRGKEFLTLVGCEVAGVKADPA